MSKMYTEEEEAEEERTKEKVSIQIYKLLMLSVIAAVIRYYLHKHQYYITLPTTKLLNYAKLLCKIHFKGYS